MKQMARYAQNLYGIHLTQAQLQLFERYEHELLSWNARMNLTAIQTPEQVRIKHFLDSLTCLCVMRDSPMDRVIDIGTGAGFPGLPLKIVVPSMQLTLVESVGKKVSFLRHIVKTLGLEGVTIIQDRAENLGRMPDHREAYDWALARAVAILPVLEEYLLPFVHVGGAMIAMKGESGPAEAHSAEHASRLLGGHLRKVTAVTLPGVADERYLVVVDKVAATPDGFPRRPGIPAKKSL